MDFFLLDAEGMVQDSTMAWLEGNGIELLANCNWNSDLEKVCELLELHESSPAEPNPRSGSLVELTWTWGKTS